AGPMPIPFGRREIIWLEKMKRTDEIYGYSPIQVLANSLQMLIWMIESDLEYFNDNNVPKGIIGLDDADSDDIEAFRDQWYNNQRKKDEFGNYKKMMHKVPIVNKIPKFTRIEFSASEMQLIEKQKWYSKMVWACFGVTATELGYTEDAQGQANQIVQSKVFRKKAINPMLRKLSSHYNKEIVSEFGYEHLQFKFLIFDIDEERSKYELYTLQTENGLKTINECRNLEGDKPLDWGDEPPKNWKQSENTYNMNGFGEKPFGEREEEEAQETDEARKLPEKREDDGKPPKEEKKSTIKKKTLNSDNPLILGENERPTDYKRLEKAILYVLKENEDGINEILESEMKENAIAGLKDINSVIAKIKALLSFEGLRQITNAMMKNNYLEGWDEAEEQMDRNYVPDSDAIDYLSDYTFGNIKGMNDDIANKLRQELQRGFMDGEGITQIKERVKKVFDVGENRAEQIARTETTRSSNFGKLHAYQKAGVKGKKRWLTHFDNRTSDVCKRLDGQEVGIDEDFHDAKTGWKGKVPPAHVSCRSDWIFVPE
ncbi:phage portal protein, partial [candidate division WOR-3 bacterium]|nr:phage portal protein [candidate division WOR-3 bacterium]